MKDFIDKNATWIEIAVMVVFAVLIMVFASGCQSPTSATPPVQTTPVVPAKVVVLKNSVWATVTPSLSSRSLARDVTGADLVAYVADYNATHFDDFLRIYDGVDAPSLDDAPDVSVYIVNPATYNVNWSSENIPRRSLVDNAAAWKHDAYGQLLFIDHVPPAPVVTPPPSLYAWYAIYEVDNTTGAIVLEEHCGYWADESFHGQFIFDGGWSSVDAYYQTYLHVYEMDAVVTSNNVHVVTRQLYTAP